MIPTQIGDVVGDYIVIGIAGSGGMGAVYKIEHAITKRIEAMKLLPPGLSNDPEQVRRFEREIQLQARLHHPNIVGLYNAVRAGDSTALVMEYVEGESLQRMLEAGPLPVETAVDFARQVLLALAYAHKAGVIHRDVSPTNIIITPDLVAKLTDFGLARGATDLRLSTSGVPMGSPWYMSPEQVRGIHELDARTDLYALGAVLHEMLTGRKLFEGEGSFAIMRAHVEAEPPPPSSRNPLVPPALDDIALKAVAKDPAMRFQSADDFHLALRNLADGVRPMPAPSNYRKTCGAVLLALAPAALVAGLYTTRFLPAAREQVTESSPRAEAISKHDADPVSPAVAAPSEVEAPGVVASTPSDASASPGESKATARPPVQSPSKALRRASKPEQNVAARVAGRESQPVAAIPAPTTDVPQPLEGPEPVVPDADSVEAPQAGALPATAGTPELAATSQGEAPAKEQNAGNRFVRALGKVNPFRRWMKPDAPKAEPKKD